jgi:hypothetical protein
MKVPIMLFFPTSCQFLFGPNNLLSTLFPIAISLCSSLNIRDQVSLREEIILQIYTTFSK